MADDADEGVEVELIAQARALHAYVPTPSEEDQTLTFLAFQKGDLIDVIEMHESGWWEGSCRDNIGLFPGSYVEIVEHYTTSKAADEDEADDSPALASPTAATAAAAAPVAAAAAAAVAGATTAPAAAAAPAAALDDVAALLEARRFALQFKKMYDAKVVELQAALAQASAAASASAGVGGGGADPAELQHALSQVAALQQQLAESAERTQTLEAAKSAAELRVTQLETQVEQGRSAAAGGDEGSAAALADVQVQLEAAQAGLADARQQLEAAQSEAAAGAARVGELEQEVASLRAAAAEAPPPAAAAAADPNQIQVLEAELKLAKQQRMALQKRVDEMDVELRNALDTANEAAAAAKELEAAKEKIKALESGGAAAIPQELGDTDVLKAELKLAKQQRMALQTRVDEMDMELRNALDSANEAAAAAKELEAAKAKIAQLEAGGGAGGGGGGGGGASSEDLDKERTKRERAEQDLKSVKEELESLKKNSGSSSIMQIKLQAMEKELTKARAKLEASTDGPKKEIEELTAQLKEFKDKSRKLEAELDVALNRANTNEEAVEQKKELRKQLDELREQMSKGKEPEKEASNPKYKIEKLERENTELKEKLAAVSAAAALAAGAAGAPAAAVAAPATLAPAAANVVAAGSHPPSPGVSATNSPMVKRLKAPGKANPAGGGGGGGPPPKPSGGEDALRAEIAEKHARIVELEREVKEAKEAKARPAAAAAAAPAAAAPAAAPQVAELKEALARRDERIAELEAKVKDHSAPSSARGALADDRTHELREAQQLVTKREAQVADLEMRLKSTVASASAAESQLRNDLRRAQDDANAAVKKQERDIAKLMTDLKAMEAKLKAAGVEHEAAVVSPKGPPPSASAGPAGKEEAVVEMGDGGKAPKKMFKVKGFGLGAKQGQMPKSAPPKKAV